MQKLKVVRTLSLRGGQNRVEAAYQMVNEGRQKEIFTWNNHPDLAPGKSGMAGNECRIIVPTRNGLIIEPFAALLDKKHYVPNQGWCVGVNESSQEYFAQKFDLKLIDRIGVYQGGNFYTMELIFKGVELRPGQSREFSVEYLAGTGDWRRELE